MINLVIFLIILLISIYMVFLNIQSQIFPKQYIFFHQSIIEFTAKILQQTKQKKIIKQYVVIYPLILQQSQMIKRYSQRKQAKCNFCFEWFNSACTMKNSIHLCGTCLDKALKTTCYKVPSPDGKQMYQLYLFKNNVKVEEQAPSENQINLLKNNLIQNIDDYRNQQLKKLSEKWGGITEIIDKLINFGSNQMDKFTNIFNDQIKNYPTAKQVLQKKQEKPPRKTQTTNFQHPAEVYLKTEKAPIIPLSIKNNKNTSKTYNSPSRKPLKQVHSPNKKFQISDFGKSTNSISNKGKQLNSSKLNKHCRNSQVSVASYQQQPETQAKYLNKNPSKQNLFLSSAKKRQQMIPYTTQKRQKDLQIVAQNALKAKIYNYLQTQSSVYPALFLPMTFQIYDAIQNTSCLNKCIELVSYNIELIDIKCYLNMLQWSGVDVLKLVKVGLTDQQFKCILDFLKDKRIQTLVVTSNKLSEQAIVYLNEVSKDLSNMRNTYLGRNRVQKMKVKDQIKQIETRFLLYL